MARSDVSAMQKGRRERPREEVLKELMESNESILQKLEEMRNKGGGG